jgi:hypothetical protein
MCGYAAADWGEYPIASGGGNAGWGGHPDACDAVALNSVGEAPEYTCGS